MECNKYEASRAMLMAEQKLKNNDIAGARRFAYKAKSMSHDLEGIEQLTCTIDVLFVSSQTDDAYEILSVDRSSDPIALKKRYKKLVLLLHPDKNKFSGANAAFDVVYKAYQKLSEEVKTELIKGHSTTGDSQQSSTKATASNSPAPCSEGESQGFGANAAASEQGKKQQTGAATNAASDPPKTSNESAATPSSTVGGKKKKSQGSSAPPVYRHATVHRTFWTLCDKCDIKFKYPTVFKDQTIKCHTCHHSYQATEIPEPTRN